MMPDDKRRSSEFNWRVSSFEGARREQLRRWARLPLERLLLVTKEMQDLAQAWGTVPGEDRKMVFRNKRAHDSEWLSSNPPKTSRKH